MERHLIHVSFTSWWYFKSLPLHENVNHTCDACFLFVPPLQSDNRVCECHPAHPPDQHDHAGLQDGGVAAQEETHTHIFIKKQAIWACVICNFIIFGCMIYDSALLRRSGSLRFKANRVDSNCQRFLCSLLCFSFIRFLSRYSSAPLYISPLCSRP